MAAVGHVGFRLGYGSPPTKCKWWSLLYPQISAWSNLKYWGYCVFHIFAFWLETAYSRSLLRGFGAFPQMTSSIVLTPKKHLLARKHVVWAIKRENRSNVRLGCVHAREKKDMTVKKSPAWGEAATELICAEICTVVAVPDIITCAKFWTEISNFPIDSRMGLRTVQYSANALSAINSSWSVGCWEKFASVKNADNLVVYRVRCFTESNDSQPANPVKRSKPKSVSRYHVTQCHAG